MVLSARAMGHLFSYLSDEVDGGLRQAYSLATHLLDALLSTSAEAWVTHESPRHWHGTRREIWQQAWIEQLYSNEHGSVLVAGA